MRRTPNILHRLRLRVKHGVQRPDAVFEALRRNPPPSVPLLKRPLEEIVLPTDDLAARYRERAAQTPAVPLAAPGEDPAIEFAARQLARMRRDGLSEDAAREAIEADDVEGDAAAAAAARALVEGPWGEHEAARAAFAAADAPDVRAVDAWLIAEVLRLDWFRARRAHEQLAVADVEGEAAASDLAIAVADLRRAALGEAPPDNRPLELSREPDADFLARHDVLAERAKSLPWAEWDQSAKEEMAAFLADLEVDDVSGPVATPGASDDAARLAAFPEFDPALRVRAASDPADVSRTLARHGLYPQMDADAIDEVLDKGIVKEENKHVTASIRSELADPASRSRTRSAAARRAHVEQAFFDRISKHKAARGGEA